MEILKTSETFIETTKIIAKFLHWHCSDYKYHLCLYCSQLNNNLIKILQILQMQDQ